MSFVGERSSVSDSQGRERERERERDFHGKASRVPAKDSVTPRDLARSNSP